MLNIIWPLFIMISFLYAIFNGNIEDINKSIFESAQSCVEFTITFFGTICLWNGIIKIVQETSLIEKLSKILIPLINFLFPECKEKINIKKDISMNMIANFLGLGNAATPLGLKVMKNMQNENKDKEKITKSMAMFIAINTASIQIIPTTAIAIRNSLNSSNSSKIILPVWVATIVAFITVVASVKIFGKINNKLN